MVETLIFVNYGYQVEYLLRRYSSLVKKDNTCIVPMDFGAKYVLVKLGLPFRDHQEYFTNEQYKETTRIAIEWAKTWYSYDELNEYLKIEAENIARVSVYEIFHFLNMGLRTFELIRTILDKEKPRNIYVFEPGRIGVNTVYISQDEDLIYLPVSYLAKQLHIKINVLKQPFLIYHREGLERTIKDKTKNIFKTIRSRMLALKYLIKLTGYNNSSVPVFLLPMPERWDKLLSERIRCSGASVMLLKDIRRLSAKNNDKKLLSCAEEHIRNKKVFCYKNHDLWFLYKRRFEYFFNEYFPSVRRQFFTIKNLIRRFRPKVLVTAYDHEAIYKLAVILARQNGIKTLMLQEGISGFSGDYDSILDIYSECVALVGNYDREFYTEHKHFSGEMYVTGSPRYDIYSQGKFLTSKAEIKKKYGIPEGNKIVLLATQHADKSGSVFMGHLRPIERERKVSCVVNSVKRLDDVSLIIKVHPGDENYRFMYDIIGNEKNVLIVRNENISELVAASDLLLTWCSTVIYEAIILNVPIIILNLFGLPDRTEMVKLGLALGAYSPEELKVLIKKALYEPGVREKLANNQNKLRDYMVSNLKDGAVPRIAGLVAAMGLENESKINFA